MTRNLVSINDLPPDGRDFELDDQAIWEQPMADFKMNCRISSPLSAKIHVLPAENGCLVRGRITGGIVLPCNRCTDDVEERLDSVFEDYEEIPQEDAPRKSRRPQEKKAPDAAPQEESRIVFEQHSPFLDLDAVCWEQFMLALPFNPLCKADCKGLCPHCGANLNSAPCSCHEDDADPRLAKLRGLTIKQQ